MATFKAKDGTQIYYKEGGAGKPILFSHGWPLDGDMWDSQLNYLAERGFRAIAFDRRGFGRSDQPWNGYDYDTFASDINDLITTLDLQDVTLVGFSMGGGDVTRYINNYGSARVAGLALLGAVTPIFGKSDSFPQGVDQSVFDGIRDGLRKDRAQFISDFATPFYGINAGQTVSAGALTQTLNIALLASLKGTIDCVTAFGETDFRPDMAKIDVPTLGGTVELKSPPGSDAGRRLRLRGRGLPGATPGDQIVELEITAPVPATEAQRKAYKQLQKAFEGAKSTAES